MMNLANKHVVVERSGSTGLDGKSKPGGEYHIMEYEDDEWVGGCYANAENLHEKIQEFLYEHQ